MDLDLVDVPAWLDNEHDHLEEACAVVSHSGRSRITAVTGS